MEPISFLISSIIGGIIGNRSDELLRQVMETLRERLRQGGKPVNHDLQKAVRKAYLQATIVLIDARLRELGVEPNLLRRDIRHLFRLADEPRQLFKARHAIEQELKRLPGAAYAPPTSQAEQEIELLLQPRGEQAAQRTAAFRNRLKDRLLEDLRSWGVQPLTPRLQAMLQDGWQETTELVRLDWFDLLCAFFAEELKTNSRVATIFQSQLLANLSLGGISIDYDPFTQQLAQLAGDALPRLQAIEQQLQQLREEQREAFEAIEGRLDAFLPALMGGMEQIQSLLTTLKADLRRRPLYEQYSGMEIALRTRSVMNRYLQLFVGRQKELEQLDALFAQPSGVLVITAPAGYGKTALLANWIDLRHGNGCFIVHHFFRKEYDDANRLDSLRNALYHLLRQLYLYYGIDESPPSDEGMLRDALLGLLHERGAGDGEPLVLLLDGLDEAEQPLVLTLPEPMPEGVYVVVSFRADENETPPPMRSWLQKAQRLHLERLMPYAIAEYLTRAGDGELATFAREADFVNQVSEKTQGYPLHLHFLTDELLEAVKRGDDARAVLQRTPRGFGEYVQQQIEQLARVVANAPGVQRLFALLATAQGVLSETEIMALTPLTPFDAASLPWQVRRWFTIQERNGTRLYAFTHPRLGDAFESALGSLAQDARRQLLDHCARWGEHCGPYALRHYAAHLYEAQAYEPLYALARDEAYAQAQTQNLPDEPDLPIRTLQLALQAAIEHQNPVRMAEMLLRLAQQLQQMETPLDALKRSGLERAIGLAKQMLERNYQLGTDWLLLLAYQCHTQGDPASAERCLKEILAWWEGKSLEKLDHRRLHGIAALMLGFLGELGSAVDVAAKVLDSKGLAMVTIDWVQAGQLAQALQVAQQIEWVSERAQALRSIAVALAQAGQSEQALQVAQQIEWASERAEALRSIAVALAQAGQQSRSREVIQNAWSAAQQRYTFSMLWSVVGCAIEAGFSELAIEYAQQIAGDRSNELPKVLDMLVQRGERQAVLKLLPLCGLEFATALHACACLIRLYPDSAAAVAEQVLARA